MTAYGWTWQHSLPQHTYMLLYHALVHFKAYSSSTTVVTLSLLIQDDERDRFIDVGMCHCPTPLGFRGSSDARKGR